MNPDQLDEMIQDLLGGVISQEKLEILEHELTSNSLAMARYLEHTDLENALCSHAEINSYSKIPVVPIERIRHRQRQKTFKIAVLAAAASVIFLLIAMRLFQVTERVPVLAFEVAPGTQYELVHEGSGKPPEENVMESGSRVRVLQGTMELKFTSGVRAIVSAPADITLHDDDFLFISEGMAWFQVPPQAVGFTVKTRDFTVVDLGTEFGVCASPSNHDAVHVFKGKVQVSALKLRQESMVLSAGQSRRIDHIGRLVDIPVAKGLFLTSLPEGLLFMHWSFDRAVEGAFLAAGNHPLLERGTARPETVDAESLLTSGRYGKALQFTGATGEGVLTRWAGISGTRPRTVACWIKVDQEAEYQETDNLVSWGLNKPGFPGWHGKWKLTLSDRLVHSSGYDGRRTAIKDVVDGDWHHVACTYAVNANGEPDVKIFIDGEAVPNQWQPELESGIRTSETIVDYPLSDPVIFGADLFTPGYGHLYRFRGLLDEVYIFEGVLDAPTIRRLSTENQYQPSHQPQTLLSE
ncbi:MAG: FecR domain-containing protein [Akkermansiaceae bacterium]|nr:FecR domain-containing protein [Akkermansiaceae bacterium]